MRRRWPHRRPPCRHSKCLAHAGDEQPNATLKQLGETGEIDARGVPITEALVDQILAAAQRDPDDHPTFRAARFERATFQGAAWFREATFQSAAEFDNATFEGAWFDGATFQRYAGFGGTTSRSVMSLSRPGGPAKPRQGVVSPILRLPSVMALHQVLS